MDAYKREDGMVVIELSVEEAEALATRMAEEMGVSDAVLELVLAEVRR